MLRKVGCNECADGLSGINSYLVKIHTQFNNLTVDQLETMKALYTFTRNGVTYSPKQTETLTDFFKRMSNEHGIPFEAHHIFPIQLFKTKGFREWYKYNGSWFKINAEDPYMVNMLMLEKIVGNVGVHESHLKYNDALADFFAKRYKDLLEKGASAESIAENINDAMEILTKNLKTLLINKSIKDNVKVNDLLKSIDDVEAIIK